MKMLPPELYAQIQKAIEKHFVLTPGRHLNRVKVDLIMQTICYELTLCRNNTIIKAIKAVLMLLGATQRIHGYQSVFTKIRYKSEKKQKIAEAHYDKNKRKRYKPRR